MERRDSYIQEDEFEVRYILLTQCMQNDFFLNRESRLRLPDAEVEKILIGKNGPHLETASGGGRMRLPDGFPDKGPLGRFLAATIGFRINSEGGAWIAPCR